ncbi:LuxR C-terminal-related transcriptional regulator [Hymenobacter sp.]|jgi:DNA-binding CsgD family transcriptional regulator|uniref:LuxR C-terminal-related transcriptional regulator n=1 Tax=Hymenobacter sp. TaxID=1898978 RepID=UPI002ED88618
MKQVVVDEGAAFVTFLEELRFHYDDLRPDSASRIEEYLATVPVWPNQFLYIHDIASGQFYHKGFAECLGYELDELTADFFVRNIHPADRSTYFNVSKALLSFVLAHAAELVPFISTFQMNYRVRRLDGRYITVLRQNTPFLKNANNEVVAYLSFCTDISLITDTNRIKWNVEGPKSETFPQFLHNHLHQQQPLFSEREQHILRLVGQGLSSTAISEKLFISINTVNTHRKSLMKKANVNKTIDLIAYAQENGYI